MLDIQDYVPYLLTMIEMQYINPPSDGETKMNNTIKLNNGALVAAREVKGKMSSYTFANLTQAEAHADKWGGKVCKFRGGRVFYVRMDAKN